MSNPVESDERTPLYRGRLFLAGEAGEEELLYAIEYFRDQGRWDALRSWAEAALEPDVLLVKLEDLLAEPVRAWRRVLDSADVKPPEALLTDMVEAYSFERLTGRSRDEADKRSHRRGGGSNQWSRYFDDEINGRFESVAGDLVTTLGY